MKSNRPPHLLVFVLMALFTLPACHDSRGPDSEPLEQRALRINRELAEAAGVMDALKIKTIDILRNIEKYRDGVYDSKRYGFFKDTVLFTPEDDGHCEAWASGVVPIDARMFSKIKALENLCPDMTKIYHDNPLFTSVYISTRDAIVFSVPYSDANTYLEPELDIATAWVTYWRVDEKHNPERRTVWVEPYLDALGWGYMVSIIAPVYVGNHLEATLGIDITCETLRDRYLSDKNRHLMFIDEKGVLVAINASCANLLNTKGPGKYDYLQKESVNAPTPEEYHLLNNPDKQIRELTEGILASAATFTIQLKKQRYKVTKALMADVGWFLVELQRI